MIDCFCATEQSENAASNILSYLIALAHCPPDSNPVFTLLFTQFLYVALYLLNAPFSSLADCLPFAGGQMQHPVGSSGGFCVKLAACCSWKRNWLKFAGPENQNNKLKRIKKSVCKAKGDNYLWAHHTSAIALTLHIMIWPIFSAKNIDWCNFKGKEFKVYIYYLWQSVG